jgi:hypothetical protein
MDVNFNRDIKTLIDSAPPPVMSGPPSLALFIGEVSAPSDAAAQRTWIYYLLRWLGPRLRSIEYTFTCGDAAGPVQQVLRVTSEGHLVGLRRLIVTNNQPEAGSYFEEHLRVLPTTCPHLEYLRLDHVALLNARLLSILMAMPALEHLELFAVGHKDTLQPKPAPIPVAWPAGKEPMCLKLWLLQASFISVLPFQHISKLRCDTLDMQATPDSTVAGETQKLRRLLELLQSKGAVLQVGRIMGSNLQGQWRAAGLSALTGPGCRIVFSNPRECSVFRMLLDAPDITAIARTWGSQLQRLILRCNLTPAAWAAMTASNFPGLKYLEGLNCRKAGYRVDSTGLQALCTRWPKDRQLWVTVRGSYGAACCAALQLVRLGASNDTDVRVTAG